jgi:hypothetical protein
MEAELKNKSDNYIQLKNNENILKLGIRDAEGNDTGEYLEFNLEDIELPLKYQRIIEEDKKNRAYLKNQFTIIEKKQDHKGKKLLSSNEEEKLKAMMNFYKKEVEIYNLFLGENGVQKLLNGRELSWTTLDEIDEIIVNVIIPKLEINAENISDKIMKKYSNKNEKQRDDIIE